MQSVQKSKVNLSGVLGIIIETPEPEKVIVEGLTDVEGLPALDPLWHRDPAESDIWVSEPMYRPNAFVNLGLQIALDRLFGLNGPPGAVSHIGVSSDSTAVTAATTTVGGTVSIKAISPAASRTGQIVTAGATFTQADVAFAIRKVFLLNSATDAGTGLIDVIGGSGVAPYDEPFNVDLTGVSSFSLTMQIQVTAEAA